MSLPKQFSDAKLSRIQSVLAEMLRRHEGVSPESVHQHPIMQQATSLLAANQTGEELPGGAFVECLQILVQYLEALVEFDFAEAMAKKNEFKDAQCDPGWIEAAAVWFWYYHVEHKRPQYNVLSNSEGCYPLVELPGQAPSNKPAGSTRIGLIADWGTGQEVSGLVLNEVFKQTPDVILHLGDVYYAGTAHENSVNAWDVLEKMRSKHGRQVPFYNLAGNHDYYSGGHGFYQYIARFNRGLDSGSVQQASYFALQNEHWQLQALDTGYNDRDLPDVGADTTFLRPDEIAWHQAQIAKAGGRKIILLSHHQLFSALTGIGSDKNWYNPALVSALQAFRGSLASGGSIVAWLWGHEHLLEVYGTPTSAPARLHSGVSSFNWPIGRCIGCGAFPVLFNDGKPYQQRDVPVCLVDDPNATGKPLELGTTQDGEAYNHGYVIMDLVGSTANVKYFEVPGDGLPFPGATEENQFSRLRYRETW